MYKRNETEQTYPRAGSIIPAAILMTEGGTEGGRDRVSSPPPPTAAAGPLLLLLLRVV